MYLLVNIPGIYILKTARMGGGAQVIPAPVSPTTETEANLLPATSAEKVEADKPTLEPTIETGPPDGQRAEVPEWPPTDVGGNVELEEHLTDRREVGTPSVDTDQFEPSAGTEAVSGPIMGAIRFPASRAAPSLWARVPMSAWNQSSTAGCSESEAAERSSMLMVCTQMMKMKPPDAIISVLARPVPTQHCSATADAAQHTSASSRRDASTVPSLEGLRRAAERMGAWVTTRGLRGRAVSAVGRAMRNSSCPCIGIAPWAAVLENTLLAHKAGKVHQYALGVSGTYASGSSLGARARWHQATEKTIRLNESVQLFRGGTRQEVTAMLPEEEMSELDSQEPLDASHTHFLLLDTKDGFERRRAGERGIELFARCALESYISNADANNNGIETPLLVLVIGGDQHTLQIVHEYLRGDHPIVVLAASGVSNLLQLG